MGTFTRTGHLALFASPRILSKAQSRDMVRISLFICSVVTVVYRVQHMWTNFISLLFRSKFSLQHADPDRFHRSQWDQPGRIGVA